jgi:hypothetical protein
MGKSGKDKKKETKVEGKGLARPQRNAVNQIKSRKRNTEPQYNDTFLFSALPRFNFDP